MWLDTLKQMKKASKKTLEQISIESGVPKGTLNRIFGGQTADPQYKTLHAIVHCLGYTVDDLESNLDEKTSPTPEQSDAGEVEKVDKFLTDLLVGWGYIQSGEDITDADAEFLISWAKVLGAWFKHHGKGG